jgi:Fe-S-cluster containining protein
MDIRDVLPRALEGTSLQEPLERLHGIYARISEAQAEWIAASPYRCPPGCGSCCDGFEPDVLEIEALYLAAWLARTDADRFARIQGGLSESKRGKGCPLADPSSRFHCTVYGGRPLVCRLFAFSGDRAKDGSARFKLCSRMPADGPRQMDETTLLDRFGVLPPIMGDLSGEAESLLPDRAGERLPLRDALESAAAKIRYLSDLAASSVFASLRVDLGGEDDGDNDNPGGGEPPMPRAG